MITLYTDPALLDATTHLVWAMYLLAISGIVLIVVRVVDALRDLFRLR